MDPEFIAAALDEANDLIVHLRGRAASLNAAIRQRDAEIADLTKRCAELEQAQHDDDSNPDAEEATP